MISPELLRNLVVDELDKNILPRVAPGKNTGKKCQSMERYCGLRLQELINRGALGSIEFTPEGCRADMIYSIGNSDEKCLGIQLKTTARSRKNRKAWIFSCMDKPYDNLLTVLHCIEECKTWMIPYNQLREKYNCESLFIYQGEEAQKFWKKFEVNKDNIAQTVHKYYMDKNDGYLKHLDKTECLISMTPTHQVAYANYIAFKKRLPFLEITKAHLDNDFYDSFMNGLKVQEKSAIKCKGRHDLHVNMNIEINKKTRIYYYTGLFDVVVIHITDPYEKYFYFIPVSVLVERGIVAHLGSKGKYAFTIYPPGVKTTCADTWANDFVFDYTDKGLDCQVTQGDIKY